MTTPTLASRVPSREKLMRWDLFCRVVDNLGDAAVMWRLARQLSVEHGRKVRLFVDQPEVLRRLVPAARVGVTVEGVEIHALAPSDEETGDQDTGDEETGGEKTGDEERGHKRSGNEGTGREEAVGQQSGGLCSPASEADVVVAGFHAALPPSYRSGMTTLGTRAVGTTVVGITGPGAAVSGAAGSDVTSRTPIWINLEYLSAEDWIEGFHRRSSPHADGLTEWFFYPGFTPASGGLLRESDLIGRREAFRRDGGADGFLADLGVHRQPGETVASLLCYPGAPLALLARRLADSSARLQLLVAQDPTTVGAVGAVSADDAGLVTAARGRLRITRIPFLPQRQYDPLLWSCDLNFVRGEDSLVRAVWSGKPFVWQIYPQAQNAHLPKLEAFLRLLPGRPLADATRWWNRVPAAADAAMMELIERPERARDCLELVAKLSRATDLSSRLLEFVNDLAAHRDRDRRIPGKL